MTESNCPMLGSRAVTGSLRRCTIVMDTLLTIEVPNAAQADGLERLERAFAWFEAVEATCSRFEPESELRRLTAQLDRAVAVSSLLFRAVQFAVAVAEASDGAFDPTLGRELERRGFNRNHRSGEAVGSATATREPCSYRELLLDAAAQTISLRRPLVLDLGAVAKGMAIDLAVEELRSCENYAINAGGDVFVRGHTAAGEPWRIGIRDPLQPDRLLDTLALTEGSVCSSGGYERPSGVDAGEHHILDPRSGRSPRSVAGVSVIAPVAMLADALATAAFVLGPERGLRLLQDQGVEGLIVTYDAAHYATPGYGRYRR